MTSLLMLSLDRFWAMRFPHSYHQKDDKTALNILLLSWMFPMILGVLPLIGWNGKDKYENKCIVTTMMDFKLTVLCFSYIFAHCIAMIVLYALIYSSIKKRELKRRSMSIQASLAFCLQASLHKPRKTEIKIAKTFVWVIGAFIVCYAPLNINFLVVAVTRNGKFFQTNNLLRVYHVFSICIAHFNSAVNPFIYAYKVKHMRDKMKEILKCNFKT